MHQNLLYNKTISLSNPNFKNQEINLSNKRLCRSLENISKNNFLLYSKKNIHQIIVSFLINYNKNLAQCTKIISLLRKMTTKELKNQVRLIVPYLAKSEYLDWLNQEKEEYFDQIEQFNDLYISICTSNLFAYNKKKSQNEQMKNFLKIISLIKKQYVKEMTITENSFNWMANEPLFHDCSSIINHLLELFSDENEPEFENISIGFLYKQLNIFIFQCENHLLDFEFGKSAFVIFKITLMLFDQTKDGKYKKEIIMFMNDVWNEMKYNFDISIHFEILNGFFSFDNFVKLSFQVFSYYWNR